jgi:hypothetical protein
MNNKIIRSAKDFQDQVYKRNMDISKSFIKLESLHITLFALHLKDRDQLN